MLQHLPWTSLRAELQGRTVDSLCTKQHARLSISRKFWIQGLTESCSCQSKQKPENCNDFLSLELGVGGQHSST